MEHPNLNAKIATQEGPAAYDEAICFLKIQKPVAGLIPSKGLMKVAKDMCNCYARDKEFDIDATIEKYGEFDGEFGSLIEYGGRTPEISLLLIYWYVMVIKQDNTEKLYLNPQQKKLEYLMEHIKYLKLSRLLLLLMSSKIK